jgi:hypothetical protein
MSVIVFLVKLILWCRTMLGLLGLTKNKRADIHVYICFKAEDEGFKPPIPVNGYTGFRVQRIRSLCQSSINENSNQMQKTNCKV